MSPQSKKEYLEEIQKAAEHAIFLRRGVDLARAGIDRDAVQDLDPRHVAGGEVARGEAGSGAQHHVPE